MTKNFSLSGSVLFLALSSCATKSLITPDNAMKSKIEINYALGRSQYKYVAIGGKDQAEVSSFKDEKLLEKKSISPEKYQAFASKLENAIHATPSSEPQENCRTPYKIDVMIAEKESTFKGCRSDDTNGQIGKLLREGEFIFYSEEKENLIESPR